MLSPFMRDAVFLAVTFWPVLLILQRLGLPRLWAALLLLSLVLPLLGHFVVALLMATRPWPNFPPLLKRAPRERLT